MKRREVILGGILAAAVGLYFWWNHGAETLVAGAPPSAKEKAPGDLSGSEIPALLEPNVDPPSMRENQRNLFDYSRSPEDIHAEQMEAKRIKELQERAEKQRADDARRRAEEELKRRQEIAANPPQPPRPQPPQMNFRFIGYMGEPRDPKERLVVLADSTGDGDVYVVKKGEILAEKFKVLDVDFESVTLGYVDPQFSAESRTLRIGS